MPLIEQDKDPFDPKIFETTIDAIPVSYFHMDHSGFYALVFLIEAEEKRLFYSGDFKGHGRKSSLFKAMLRNPPENIDCLLEEKIRGILENSRNITFLFAPSLQNLIL